MRGQAVAARAQPRVQAASERETACAARPTLLDSASASVAAADTCSASNARG
jgi:hypothetical protein